jgi:hypothetical protein
MHGAILLFWQLPYSTSTVHPSVEEKSLRSCSRKCRKRQKEAESAGVGRRPLSQRGGRGGYYVDSSALKPTTRSPISVALDHSDGSVDVFHG